MRLPPALRPLRIVALAAGPLAGPALAQPAAEEAVPVVDDPSPRGTAFACMPRKTCGQMSSCDEAIHALEVCGDRARDADDDRIPRESLCGSDG